MSNLYAQKAELERQLEVINANLAELKQKAQEEHANAITANVTTLLLLVPEHSRTCCSDIRPQNPNRCLRCALLKTKNDKEFGGGWDEDYRIEFNLVSNMD